MSGDRTVQLETKEEHNESDEEAPTKSTDATTDTNESFSPAMCMC